MIDKKPYESVYRYAEDAEAKCRGREVQKRLAVCTDSLHSALKDGQPQEASAKWNIYHQKTSQGYLAIAAGCEGLFRG